MYYKYEIHCHTKQASRCGESLSGDMVRAYHDKGYSGLVITDHFAMGNTGVPRKWPWERRMNTYYDAYLEARAVGEQLGMDILFGIEYGCGDGREILTYGIDLDFLLQYPDLDTVDIEEYARRVRACGGCLIQAHPFRSAPYIKPNIGPFTEILDGVEVFNWKNTDAENRKALGYAIKQNMIKTSGADIHNVSDKSLGQAGMAFPYRIENSKMLIEALKNREGRLIISGEVRWLDY